MLVRHTHRAHAQGAGPSGPASTGVRTGTSTRTDAGTPAHAGYTLTSGGRAHLGHGVHPVHRKPLEDGALLVRHPAAGLRGLLHHAERDGAPVHTQTRAHARAVLMFVRGYELTRSNPMGPHAHTLTRVHTHTFMHTHPQHEAPTCLTDPPAPAHVHAPTHRPTHAMHPAF